MSVIKSLVPPENVNLTQEDNPAKYFEVWYGESQWGRQIEAKIKANDIDNVIQWVKETYTAYEYYNIDVQSDEQAYMMINVCPECEYNDKPEEEKEDLCDHCEQSAYFEITETEDAEEALNLIFPSCHTTTIHPTKHNAYHDLTQ